MKRMLIAAAAACLLSPVRAVEVASIAGSGWILALAKEQGECPDGSQRAGYQSAKGFVPGCWFLAHGFVWVFFADGDRLSRPQEDFKFLNI